MGHQIPLTALGRGGKAVVIALPADRKHLAKLLAFGILPGSEVEVLQVFPAHVIAIGYTKLAIDREIAASIMVGR